MYDITKVILSSFDIIPSVYINYIVSHNHSFCSLCGAFTQ